MKISRVFRRSPIAVLVLAGTLPLGMITAAPAKAGSSEPRLTVSVQVEREIVTREADGKTRLDREPVDVVRPGDVLVYTVKAVNTGDAPAFDVKLQDPIPPGTVLIMTSLEAAAPSNASLDGGKTWLPFPATITHTAADGKLQTVPAPAHTYTNLRWLVHRPLHPGSDESVSFKVRVL